MLSCARSMLHLMVMHDTDISTTTAQVAAAAATHAVWELFKTLALLLTLQSIRTCHIRERILNSAAAQLQI
jgi:hypothetical protein